MPYIGREPTNSGQFLLIDDISSNFNGSNTSFDLKIGGNAINPAKENVIVALDGILQQADDAYTVSGSKITLTEAPGSGVSFYGVLAFQGFGWADVDLAASITASAREAIRLAAFKAKELEV